MTVFETALESLWTANHAARCRIRLGSYVYQVAISSGNDQRRTSDEIGTYDMADSVIRVRSSDEDGRYPLSNGKVIEVQFGQSTEWSKFRIEARRESGGVIVLGLNTEHE